MNYMVDQIKNGKYLTSFGPFNSIESAVEEIETLKISGVGCIFWVLNSDGSVDKVIDRSQEPVFIPAIFRP